MAPGVVHRLVGDHPDRATVDPREGRDDRRPGIRGHVEHVAVVEDPQQNLVHVVGRVVGVRHDRVEFEIVGRDLGLEAGVDDRRVVEGVGGQEAQVVADVLERLLLGGDDLVDVAVPGLRVGAAELVERHVLARDVLDDVGTGDEHVALVPHGDDEIGLDRRVHRTARALAEDQRDLRDQPAQQLVAAAQFGVPRE